MFELRGLSSKTLMNVHLWFMLSHSMHSHYNHTPRKTLITFQQRFAFLSAFPSIISNVSNKYRMQDSIILISLSKLVELLLNFVNLRLFSQVRDQCDHQQSIWLFVHPSTISNVSVIRIILENRLFLIRYRNCPSYRLIFCIYVLVSDAERRKKNVDSSKCCFSINPLYRCG